MNMFGGFSATKLKPRKFLERQTLRVGAVTPEDSRLLLLGMKQQRNACINLAPLFFIVTVALDALAMCTIFMSL